MGKGPEIRTDEYTTELGCMLGGRARLWTSPPVWYSEFIQQPSVIDGTTDSWDGRLELTLFVSRNTAQGLRTGKLYQSRITTSTTSRRTSETNLEDNSSPHARESSYEINPVFCADDGDCGNIQFTIQDLYDDAEEKEPVGSALARMIGKALGYL